MNGEAAMTREQLDRAAIDAGAPQLLLCCALHPDAGTRVLYRDGEVRVLCQQCGFQAHRLKIALGEFPASSRGPRR